jgi:hypothetical protein
MTTSWSRTELGTTRGRAGSTRSTLAELLRRPGGRRMVRDGHVNDPPTLMSEDHQNEQQTVRKTQFESTPCFSSRSRLRDSRNERAPAHARLDGRLGERTRCGVRLTNDVAIGIVCIASHMRCICVSADRLSPRRTAPSDLEKQQCTDNDVRPGSLLRVHRWHDTDLLEKADHVFL